jgi:hypothetical protein
MTATDPDAYTIRDTPAPSQLLNLQLFNALVQLASSVSCEGEGKEAGEEGNKREEGKKGQ